LPVKVLFTTVRAPTFWIAPPSPPLLLLRVLLVMVMVPSFWIAFPVFPVIVLLLTFTTLLLL
jgi:hypothetical protein